MYCAKCKVFSVKYYVLMCIFFTVILSWFDCVNWIVFRAWLYLLKFLKKKRIFSQLFVLKTRKKIKPVPINRVLKWTTLLETKVSLPQLSWAWNVYFSIQSKYFRLSLAYIFYPYYIVHYYFKSMFIFL